MRKIVEEVVANEEKVNKKGGKKSNKKSEVMKNSLTRQTLNRSVKDRELEEVLSGLTTTIKVVGCGGTCDFGSSISLEVLFILYGWYFGQ